MMRRRYAPSYHIREIQRKKVEKVEGEKILQREREKENRKKEMMEWIEIGMADISRILEEISFKSKMIIERVEKKTEKKNVKKKR